MALPSKYSIEKKINSMEGLSAYENGGKGSGNFGHGGRPGKVGGSSSGGLSGISRAIAGSKKNIDQAKIVQEDIEDRIGQKVKKGEEYTALDEATKSRFKTFHGEDGTEYTYDKENGMITETNPKTGDQEVVTKQKEKDREDFLRGVEERDGATARSYVADISSALGNGRTNLKSLKEDMSNYDKLSKDEKTALRQRTLTRRRELAQGLRDVKELLSKKGLSKGLKSLASQYQDQLTQLIDDFDKTQDKIWDRE